MADPFAHLNMRRGWLVLVANTLLLLLMSACGRGNSPQQQLRAATATATAHTPAAIVPVAVTVAITQTQPVAGGHPALSATVAIHNQTAQPIYLVASSCSRFAVEFDISNADGLQVYRYGGPGGCIAGAIRSWVVVTVMAGATDTMNVAADLTGSASELTAGQTYQAQASIIWRSQDGTYMDPDRPPEYKASSDLVPFILR